jgi:hypothetical protein
VTGADVLRLAGAAQDERNKGLERAVSAPRAAQGVMDADVLRLAGAAQDERIKAGAGAAVSRAAEGVTGADVLRLAGAAQDERNKGLERALRHRGLLKAWTPALSFESLRTSGTGPNRGRGRLRC